MRKNRTTSGRRNSGNPDRPTSKLTSQLSISTEVHLRRMKVRAALDLLDAYLNDAILAGLPRVHVIHGKGTGILKNAVLEFLSQHSLVDRHHPAAPGEGGGGVTIAELK